MRMYLSAALLSLALCGGATAAEPFPGFADRLVMACGHTGVVNVLFSESGTLESYLHTEWGKKPLMEECLRREYAEIADAQYPSSAHNGATRVTILKDGTIKLF